MVESQKCGCMCGAVSFSATPKAMTMDACHCSMCRQWAGGVFLSVACSNVDLGDEGGVIVCQSSDWAERLSCAKCGSSLIWRMKDKSFQSVALPAFENADEFSLDRELFIDAKPDNYAFANKTRQLTTAQIFGAVAGGQA